ncbi:homeodomain-interacting protein kinase 2-like [Solea senegalensis]|uniref:Homeodomain-interacting protein kinase 2-like n=1 Tax=Solea senegalensis TaxID=28829 RepID=A0AAV6PVW2_SOLSE|nr:homeodomain-interacting protein kinase 2-like [Solea senegalensis]
MQTVPPPDKTKNNDVSNLESRGYLVKKLLGNGAFGFVYECRRSGTNELVAVKVINQAEIGQGEVHNLEQLRGFDPDTTNLVRFNGHFGLNGKVFLEFEKLDKSVLDLFKKSKRPFRLSEIQIITQQMLVALDTLREIEMIHTDIKLDNIMLVNHELHPFKVKLIDFGLACNVKGLCVGDILYIPEHRAPEVYLGLPLNEAVDMWALGCVIVSMYINANLFSGTCQLGTVEEIVQLLGQPDDHLLNKGMHTHKYFSRAEKDTWKLKRECSCSTGNESWNYDSSVSVHWPVNNLSSRPFSCLKDIVMTRLGNAEYEDSKAFLSFLTQILQVDPRKRINPSEALSHPFITTKCFPSDSPDQQKAAACNGKPPQTSGLDAAPANRAATGRNYRPQWHTIVSGLDDTSLGTPLISESPSPFEDNIFEGTTDSKAKPKNWFVKTIHKFVSWLFKRAPFTNRYGDSTAHEATSAFSKETPSTNMTTANLDEATTTSTNNGPTAAADKSTAGSENRPSIEKPLPTVLAAILDETITISTNNRPTAVADRTSTGSDIRSSDEKPGTAGTTLLDANTGPTAAGAAGRENRPSSNDKPSLRATLDEDITIHLNAGLSAPAAAGSDERPTNEKPSTKVISEEAAITTAGSDTIPRDEKPSPTASTDTSICPNDGPTAAADRTAAYNDNRQSDDKQSPTTISNEVLTICKNSGPVTAADRTADNDRRPSDEKQSPTAITDKAIPICPNDGPTAAADRTSTGSDIRSTDEETSHTALSDTKDGLTDAAISTADDSNKRPGDEKTSPIAILCEVVTYCTDSDPTTAGAPGSDTRPSNEEPSPAVILEEASGGPQGSVYSDVNTIETSFASTSHVSEEVKKSTDKGITGSKVKTKTRNRIVKKIKRLFVRVFEQGSLSNCFGVLEIKRKK